MPFKSKAQRRKFAELLVKGEISPDTFEEWNRETGRKLLPERVTKKKRVTKKTRVAKKTRATKNARATKSARATKKRRAGG
jgi:hypothetical protein